MVPVFVPSYRRPDALFLKRSVLYRFPLYVFVRKEEEDSYAWLRRREDTHIIRLKNVYDIGTTRRAMFNYAVHKGIDKIFMIDDDVGRLDLSIWDPKKKVVRASGTVKGAPEDWRVVLKAWEKLWENEAMLGASYRPFSWSMKQEDLGKNVRAQLQQAVGVNVKLIHEAGLNYQANDEVGNEDLFLQLECYQHGLECAKATWIQYDCAAMGAGEGGCNASEVGSIQEKQHRRVKKFVKACTDPKLIKVATTKSGIESVKFNWKEIHKLMED